MNISEDSVMNVSTMLVLRELTSKISQHLWTGIKLYENSSSGKSKADMIPR